jgi:hypothetical protein
LLPDEVRIHMDVTIGEKSPAEAAIAVAAA